MLVKGAPGDDTTLATCNLCTDHFLYCTQTQTEFILANWGRRFPVRVLTIWRLLHMIRHFNPFLSGLRKICILSTPIFEQKREKFWPIVLVEMYSFDSLFGHLERLESTRAVQRILIQNPTGYRFSHLWCSIQHTLSLHINQREEQTSGMWFNMKMPYY